MKMKKIVGVSHIFSIFRPLLPSQSSTMAANAPNYQELPVFWPRLKAFIEIGSFILFDVVDNNENIEKRPLQLGQIVCSTHAGSRVKVLLLECDKPNNASHHRPITSESGRCIIEAIMTSVTKEIHTADIHDVAWVFDERTLSELSACLQGISNVFIVRFNSNNEPIQDFTCFPCSHPDC
jgi:hypothetical protein